MGGAADLFGPGSFTPIRPSAEIAGIPNLLSALAERRIKQQEFADQEARLQAAQNADIAHQKLSEQRQRDALTQSDTHFKAQEARLGQDATLQRNADEDKIRRAGAEKIKAMIQSGDHLGALSLAKEIGLDTTEVEMMLSRQQTGGDKYAMKQNPATLPGAGPRPQAILPVGRGTPLEPPPFNPASDGAYTDLDDAAPAGPAGYPSTPAGPPPAEPNATPNAVPSTAWHMQGPRGHVLDYDPGAVTAATKARKASALEQFRAMRPALEKASPKFGGEAADLTEAHMAADELLKDPATAFKEAMEHIKWRTIEANKGDRAVTVNLNKPDPALGDQKKALDIEQEYTDSVDKTLNQLKYGSAMGDRAKLETLAASAVGAGDSSALAAIVSGAFVKMAQGGTGVVSDQDMRVFWSRIGGIGMRAEQAWEDFSSGKLAPDKQKVVQDAIDTLMASSKKREMDFGRAIESKVGNLERNLKAKGYWDGIPRMRQIIETNAPAYLATFDLREKERSGGGSGKAPATAPKTGGASPPATAPKSLHTSEDEERLSRTGH